MTVLLVLIPAALALGAIGLAAFLWSLRAGQYEDMDGAGERILLDDDGGPNRDPAPRRRQ
jgi:cbb3-type cytochrome oxidase maturation protein